jgi:hypothetical protein
MENRYIFQFFTKNLKEKKEQLFNGLMVIDDIISPNSIDEVILDKKKKISFEVEVEKKKIEDKNEALSTELKDQQLLLFTNESVSGLTTLAATLMQTYFSDPILNFTDCSLSLPADYINDHDQKYEICRNLSIAFKPFILYFNNKQQNYDADMHNNPAYGLPLLANLMRFHQDPWVTPISIAWINFWDKDMLIKCGLDYEKDKHLFYKSELLDGGGILFQITESPPDVNKPEDLKQLIQIYNRFPVVGGQYLLKS